MTTMSNSGKAVEGGKKKKNKNAASLKPAKKEETAAEVPAVDVSSQKRLAIMGFGFLGLLMGFLWGANSIIDVGLSDSPLVQAARVSVAVATTTADVNKGLSYGFVGIILGGSFGYGIFLQTKLMFCSWLMGALGMFVASFLGSPTLCGLGWAIGYGLVILKAAGEHFPAVYAQVQAERQRLQG